MPNIGRHGLNKSEQLKDVDFMLNSLISFLAFMVWYCSCIS